MKSTKRFLAILLVVVLLLGMAPAVSLAEDEPFKVSAGGETLSLTTGEIDSIPGDWGDTAITKHYIAEVSDGTTEIVLADYTVLGDWDNVANHDFTTSAYLKGTTSATLTLADYAIADGVIAGINTAEYNCAAALISFSNSDFTISETYLLEIHILEAEAVPFTVSAGGETLSLTTGEIESIPGDWGDTAITEHYIAEVSDSRTEIVLADYTVLGDWDNVANHDFTTSAYLKGTTSATLTLADYAIADGVIEGINTAEYNCAAALISFSNSDFTISETYLLEIHILEAEAVPFTVSAGGETLNLTTGEIDSIPGDWGDTAITKHYIAEVSDGTTEIVLADYTVLGDWDNVANHDFTTSAYLKGTTSATLTLADYAIADGVIEGINTAEYNCAAALISFSNSDFTISETYLLEIHILEAEAVPFTVSAGGETLNLTTGEIDSIPGDWGDTAITEHYIAEVSDSTTEIVLADYIATGDWDMAATHDYITSAYLKNKTSVALALNDYAIADGVIAGINTAEYDCAAVLITLTNSDSIVETYLLEIHTGESSGVPAEAPTFSSDLDTDEIIYYMEDAVEPPLEVIVNSVSDGGILTYQWYSNDENSTDGGQSISGEQGTLTAGNMTASYTPSVASEGTMYYYVIVTNTADGKTPVTMTSAVAMVTVLPGSAPAETPTFSINLSSEDLEYETDETPEPLSVTVNAVSDGGTLTYQWYRNLIQVASGGEAISGASGELTAGNMTTTYTPVINEEGEMHYYVVVTNTVDGKTPVTATSVIATVITVKDTAFYWYNFIQEPDIVAAGDAEYPDFEGYYRITSSEELAWFAALVNDDLEDRGKNEYANAVLASDIYLNDTSGWMNWDENTTGLRIWKPIASSSSSSYYRGSFSGNGHAIYGIFTDGCFQAAGLFGQVKSAEIIDLGVCDSFIYQKKHSYSNGSQNGREAGGIAGYATGTIADGFSKITNCYNTATIMIEHRHYSTYVGGIVGRLFAGEIENCYNTGLVISASYGAYPAKAGGIAGDSRGDILNCYNLGEIRGLNAFNYNWIAGITMSETMSLGTCKNCYNAGKLTVVYTSGISQADRNVVAPVFFVGRYIGSMADPSQNSYYLNGCIDELSEIYIIDNTAAEAKSEAAMTDGTVSTLLGNAFTSIAGVNDGYPVLMAFGSDTANAREIPKIANGVIPLAIIEVDTSSSTSYTVDLSGIFTGLNLNYKVRTADSGYTDMANAVYNGTFNDETVLIFTADSGYTNGEKYTVLVVEKDAEQSARMSLADTYLTAAAYDDKDYYTENDLWNGREYNETSFWTEFNAVLNDTLKIVQLETTDDAYNAQSAELKTAVENLIPAAQTNTTGLYEALEGASGKEESDYTASTWLTFSKALEDAQTLMASLFDQNGNATGENMKGKQNDVDAAAVKLIATTKGLFTVDDYNTLLSSYKQTIEEAKTWIAMFGIDDFTQSDYTAASWAVYEAAYSALEYDTQYVIVGGTAEDKAVLGSISRHLIDFKSAVRNLTSDGDITISFTYINNYAAINEGTTGTWLYENDELSLSEGSTTASDAITAAGITYDTTSPTLMVYVNGICFITPNILDNLPQNDIQLHQGDEVVVVRIPAPRFKQEYSTGYDSTGIGTYQATDSNLYTHSIAQINADVTEETIKVGDKVTISSSVNGAYLTNLSDVFSAEDITLFVSDVGDSQTLTAPQNATTAITNENGELEYVFTQSGWYTIGLFNVTEDELTFIDVYNVTTHGTYNSLFAGAYAVVYVEAADDEDAVIEAYRTEKTQEAQEYFEAFNDYDFAEGYYNDTFAAQYNTLVSNMSSATTLKELLDQYNLDFKRLQEYGDTAYDHDTIIEELRLYLSYVPGDPAEMDYTYKKTLQRIGNIYDGMNDYQKGLLSQDELSLIDELMVILDDESYMVYPAQVSVDIQLDTSTIELAESYGFLTSAPNHNYVFVLYPDGTKGSSYYKYTTGSGTEPSDGGMTAYLGDQIEVRRLIVVSDESYWPVYSVDGGTTWELAENHGVNPSATDETLFNISYIVPEDFEGSSLVIQVQGITKHEYDIRDVEEVRAAALETLQDTYDSYNLDLYDDAGQQALTAALADGIANINAAETCDEVTAARKAAIAAMRVVKTSSAGSGDDEISYDSGDIVGQIYVSIENNTYSEGDLTGTIVEGWYDLGENDSMMTMILKALELDGYNWNDNSYDYSITYLSRIIIEDLKLSEFDGGQKSGWMGTLNDWFTNEGFAAFTYNNGGIESGDIINVLYTCDYGEDIGGTWYNSNTSLEELTVSGGLLMPSFDSDTNSYILKISGDRASVMFTPKAANKNYQVKTFLNYYNKDSAYYKRTERISVKEGDILFIGVGESGWETMNSSGEPTKYTITVETGLQNTAPVLKEGVPAGISAEAAVGEAYTLDLSTIFVDEDNDELNYNVSINGAYVVSADENYSIVPPTAGVYTLVFSANDGIVDSADTYTVTLLAQDTQTEAKLSALLIHTGYSPTDDTVLLKNEGDAYDTTLVFDTDTKNYTLAEQTDGVTQLRFRALAAEDGATVTLYYGDGESKDITWTSGSSKWANCLTAGQNDLSIVVMPPDGSDKLPTVYNLTINCIRP